jgi:hypothetical protein
MTTTTKTLDPADFDALVDDLERRVWANVPAVQAALQRQQAALAAAPALHRLVAGLPTVPAVIQATYDKLAAGESVDPERFATSVAAASATVEAARHAAIVASSGNDTGRNELDAARHAHQGEALAVLDQKVTQLVVIARPLLTAVEELEGTNRYAQIGAAQVALQRATVAHTRIRTVQMQVTSEPLDVDPAGLLRTFGIVRDVRNSLPGRVAMAGPATAAYEPEVPEIHDGEALLRFVCRAELEPWVPTYARAKEAKAAFLQHVRDLQEQVQNPTRPPRDASNDPQVAVRGGAGLAPVITAW